MDSQRTDRVFDAMDTFRIELPSWGFANTGTRFGKFLQPAAATTMEEKLSDAGHVHALTGSCPTVALHVLWDFPTGAECRRGRAARRSAIGIRTGSINPNLSRTRSTSSAPSAIPTPTCARQALRRTCSTASQIARGLRQPRRLAVVCRWVELSRHGRTSGTAQAAGSRRAAELHAALDADQRLLVEYKPFEPAFYHTDIADWGMALLLARSRRPAGQGAGGHRPSLPGAEHRADRRVAARSRTCSADSTSTTAAMPTTI